MSAPRLLGAVLAGGEARRFGSDKALAEVGGRSMLERAVEALRPVVEAVVVVGERSVEDPTVDVVGDRTPGAGPLGGLQAALDEARRRSLDGVLLLGCDLPLVGTEILGALVEAGAGAPAAAPERQAGGVETLCAVYRVEIASAVDTRLESPDRSLQALFRGVGGTRVPLADLPASSRDVFLNVNTAADLERAGRAIEGAAESADTTPSRAMPSDPTVVCIVGKKKSGKTATTVGLVRALRERGHRVMTAKHGHGFELDREGTDSWRHRFDGGAERVVMVGPEQVAVTGSWGPEPEPTLEQVVARYLSDADIVVAEGFKTSGALKVEVYRRAAHEDALYGTDAVSNRDYLAILTDVSDFEADVPVLDIDDPDRFDRLADLIESVRGA